ncbi:MAG: hypothetical protein HWD82_03320 [Flavobacteriaceae bacterium]|nr:hypothetical protein [Flavobacteriaceae bacterium]
MNRNVKAVLLVLGIILLAYGFYTMVIPEKTIVPENTNIFPNAENRNAYIAIALGVLSVILSLLKESLNYGLNSL